MNFHLPIKILFFSVITILIFSVPSILAQPSVTFQAKMHDDFNVLDLSLIEEYRFVFAVVNFYNFDLSDKYFIHIIVNSDGERVSNVSFEKTWVVSLDKDGKPQSTVDYFITEVVYMAGDNNVDGITIGDYSMIIITRDGQSQTVPFTIICSKVLEDGSCSIG